MKWFARILLICGLSAVATHGWAATATTTFTVTGTVVPGCAVSAVAMSFGTTIPNPVLANIDVTSVITATCATGTPWNIGLDLGTGAGAILTARRMTSAGNTMIYSLFRDTGRTLVWGPTVGTNTVTGTGDGTAQPVTVYGRIIPQTLAASGAYSDTITVTITF